MQTSVQALLIGLPKLARLTALYHSLIAATVQEYCLQRGSRGVIQCCHYQILLVGRQRLKLLLSSARWLPSLVGINIGDRFGLQTFNIVFWLLASTIMLHSP